MNIKSLCTLLINFSCRARSGWEQRQGKNARSGRRPSWRQALCKLIPFLVCHITPLDSLCFDNGGKLLTLLPKSCLLESPFSVLFSQLQ